MRSTTATGYLHDNNYTSKANFDVLINSLVTKVLFKPTKLGGKVIASGVQIAASPNGTLHVLYIAPLTLQC